MADFDEKLNSLLSDPDAMSQMIQMAQSFFSSSQPNSDSPSGDFAPPPPPPPSPHIDCDNLGSSAGFSLPDDLDPSLFIKLLPILRELGGKRDSHARQLLYALRPYLKEERRNKVERALQLARLFHLGKQFLSEREG